MSRTASANRVVRTARPPRGGVSGSEGRVDRAAEAGAVITPTVADLMQVMHELRDLVREENEALRRGLPAAAVENTERKEKLQAKFRAFYRHLLRRGAPQLHSDQIEQLQDLGVTLRALAVENTTRLEAALTASQQRIEHVMSALRSKIAEDHTTYRTDYSNVQTLRAHFVDYGRSLEV